MIIGIGLDLADITRIEQALIRPRFMTRVFTPCEIESCQKRGTQAAASFAARFAAKEAFLKAIGTGLRGGKLQEIEVVNNHLGAPEIKLYGAFAEMSRLRGIEKIWLSLTHERQMAAAQVILWGDEKR